MRIAKIDNGKPVEITIGTVRIENKGVSFPNEPAESTLNKLGYYTVNETEKPEYDSMTQRVKASLVLESGVVSEVWTVIDIDPSVTAARVTQSAIERRRQVERSGAYWTDGNGKTYWLATDLNSQQKTIGQLSLITHGIASGVQHWKVDLVTEVTEEIEGEVETYEVREPQFRPTTHAEFKSMAAAIKDHVQKCFAAEAIVANMAKLGVYTDFDTEFGKL